MAGYLYEGMNPEYCVGMYKPYYVQSMQELTGTYIPTYLAAHQGVPSDLPKQSGHGPQRKPDRAAAALQAHVQRLQRVQQDPIKASKHPKTTWTQARSAVASVGAHPSAAAAKKGCKAQDLIKKQTKEDKSSISMPSPGHAACTKQYAAQQCKARSAPGPIANLHQPTLQVQAATITARQSQTKPVSVAPSTGRLANAQQPTNRRAQQAKAQPILNAKKAVSSDDDDKVCAACYTSETLRHTQVWRKGKAGEWYMQDMCNRCAMWEARHPGLPMQQKFLQERPRNVATYLQPQAPPQAHHMQPGSAAAAATAAMPGSILAHASSNSSNSAQTMLQHTTSDVSQTMQYSNCLFEALADVAVECIEAETHHNSQHLVPNHDAALQNAADMEDTEMALAEDIAAGAMFLNPMFQRDSRQTVKTSRKRSTSDIEQQQQQQQNKKQRTGAATGAWRQ